MAKELSPSDFKPPARRSYPWEEWLHDKTTWELAQGEDFDTDPVTMEKLIRRTAKLYGVLVSVFQRPPAKKGEKHRIVIKNNGRAPDPVQLKT